MQKIIKNPWFIAIASGLICGVIILFISLDINKEQKIEIKALNKNVSQLIKSAGISEIDKKEAFDLFEKDLQKLAKKQKKQRTFAKFEKKKGDSFYDKKEYKKAIIHYKNVLKIVESAVVYFNIGGSFYYLNNYNKALKFV